MPASLPTGLRIAIVTPAPRGSRTGNRTTALRWAGLLRQLGCRVTIDTTWRDRPADVLVAVHAVKSAEAVLAATAARPQLRVVVLLSGTDVYPTFEPGPNTIAGLTRADALIALQPHAIEALPASLRMKARTIVQSAGAVARPRRRPFTIVQLAHLREIKQPLVTIAACRLVPEAHQLELLLAGARLEADYGRRVDAAIAAGPRARWLGELGRRQCRELLAEASLHVVASAAEGGANVVSEAIAAGTPTLCTAVPGNLGLLGDDWPATFPVGDAQALADLIARCVREPAFLADLRARTERLRPMVSPAAERAAWQRLLRELTAG